MPSTPSSRDTASAPDTKPIIGDISTPRPPTTSSASPSATTSPPHRAGSLPPPSVPVPPGSAPPPGAIGGHTPHCCESGRPVLTDPISGQTVCSCQYDSHILNYQRLAASGGLPLGMYSPAMASAYGAPDGAFSLSGLPGPDQLQSAFCPPGGPGGFDLKQNLDALRNLPYAAASMYYPYDGAALGYPFGNGYGMDLNGARRKNATRETTSTLKAWLSEHRKNPYPTKGEKIMLAIITKMTLTQVSTWFANARRRLKKENKMTWSPRNRCDDDEAADAEAEKNDRLGSDSANGEGRPGSRGSRRDRDDADSDIVDIEEDSNLESPSKRPRRSGSPVSSDPGSLSDAELSQPSHSGLGPMRGMLPPGMSMSHLHNLPPYFHSQFHPQLHPQLHAQFHPQLHHVAPAAHTMPNSKPRIWSIVDIATNASNAANDATLPLRNSISKIS